MSTGVPKIVVMPMNDRRPASLSRTSGVTIAPGSAVALPPDSREARRAARQARDPRSPRSVRRSRANSAERQTARLTSGAARCRDGGSAEAHWRAAQADARRHPRSARRPPDWRRRGSSGGRPRAPGTACSPRAHGRSRRALRRARVSSAACSGKVGANPAASSSRLRSRCGTRSSSVRRRTMSRLGRARPVSRKLRCRVEDAGVEREVELADPAMRAPVLELFLG